MAEIYSALLNALKRGSVERLTDRSTLKEGLYQGDILFFGDEVERENSYVEYIAKEPHLVVFGGGHVGKALYDLASLQGMRTTYIDERESVLNESRFPKSQRILTPSFREFFNSDAQFDSPYYIIMTHGHRWDRDALKWCLNHGPYQYLGMIGSKSKVKALFDSLVKEGFKSEELEGVHSPIGININSVTPEEIAVSIIAEIISLFRSHRDVYTLSDDFLERAASEIGISIRILEKHGSAPRSVGSEILVTKESLIGTIGGGALEKNAIDKARRLLRDGVSDYRETERHDLRSSGDLNMTCGGNVTLLYALRK